MYFEFHLSTLIIGGFLGFFAGLIVSDSLTG